MVKPNPAGSVLYNFLSRILQDNIAGLLLTVVYRQGRSFSSWYDATPLAVQFFHRVDGVTIPFEITFHPLVHPQVMKEPRSFSERYFQSSVGTVLFLVGNGAHNGGPGYLARMEFPNCLRPGSACKL